MDVYMQAARAMQGSLDSKGQLKQLCLQKDVQKKRATYAVAAEASKHMVVIDSILKGSAFYEANPSYWPCLARVMAYDALFGSGLKGDTRTGAAYAVKKHMPKLKKSLGDVMKKHKVHEPAKLLQQSAPPRIPIYLRINTLVATVDEVVREFAKDGWQMLETPNNELLLAASRPHTETSRKRKAKADDADEAPADEAAAPRKAKARKTAADQAPSEGKAQAGGADAAADRKLFYRDPTLTSLLVFPPSAKWYLVKHDVCRNNKGVIQDKASCLPPYVLLHCLQMESALDRDSTGPTAGTTMMGPIMDCTAAPGNKTSLLAQISRGKRPIFAIEKDEERVEILKQRLTALKADTVKVINKSFLDIFPEEYPTVEGMLLDPSCSGSGIVDRIEPKSGQLSKEDEEARLERLAEFQTSMILHGMTFPSVRRIVYSTCSIHQRENEDVVRDVLNNEEVKGKWTLGDIMPGMWGTRALPLFQNAQHCIRYVPLPPPPPFSPPSSPFVLHPPLLQLLSEGRRHQRVLRRLFREDPCCEEEQEAEDPGRSQAPREEGEAGRCPGRGRRR